MLAQADVGSLKSLDLFGQVSLVDPIGNRQRHGLELKLAHVSGYVGRERLGRGVSLTTGTRASAAYRSTKLCELHHVAAALPQGGE